MLTPQSLLEREGGTLTVFQLDTLLNGYAFGKKSAFQ
jgi:hypothetical protein